MSSGTQCPVLPGVEYQLCPYYLNDTLFRLFYLHKLPSCPVAQSVKWIPHLQGKCKDYAGKH